MTKLAKVKFSTLIQQRNQRAHIGRMLMAVAAAIRHGVNHKHVGAIFEEYLVWSFIVVNDADGGSPVRLADVCRHLQLPRSNCRRAAEHLVEVGIVLRVGSRLTQDINYFADRIESRCFVEAKAAILTAAAALKQ